MNTANLNTLIQRYEDNFEWINNAEHDEIFKWRAVRCFQDVWFSRGYDLCREIQSRHKRVLCAAR